MVFVYTASCVRSLAWIIMGATAPLLARSHARSDDAEADSFEQPLVAPAVHPFSLAQLHWHVCRRRGVTRNN